MKKNKLSLLAFSLFTFHFSLFIVTSWTAIIGEEKQVSGGKPPNWIYTVTDGEYVGCAQNEKEDVARNDALADARKKIVDSLGIEVSRETLKEITETKGIKDIARQQSSGKIKLQTVANNIIQVKPSRWHVEKWKKTLEKGVAYYYKVYVLVPFSKQQHDAFITSLIQQTEDLSSQSMSAAKDLLKQGKTVEAIVEYFNVMNAVRSINKITGIDPMKLTTIKSMQREALQPIREFFGQLKVTSLNGLTIKSQKGESLAEPLTIKYEYKGKPLSGMPIKFRFLEGSGNITEVSITDQDGLVATNVSELQPAENKDLAVIEVRPDVDFDEIGIPVLKINVDMGKTILIRIVEKNIDEIVSYSRLENALIQGLTKERFKFVAPTLANELIENNDISSILNGDESLTKLIAKKNVANWILVGEVTTQESSVIQPGYVFSRAYANIKVIRMDNNQVIYSDNYEAKAAGQDSVKAGLKALDSMAQKFSQKIIQNLKEVLK